MTTPRLTRRIREAGLHGPVARAFAEGLRRVAEDLEPSAEREALLRRLSLALDLSGDGAPEPMPDDPTEVPGAGSVEILWSQAELFLTACLYVAVSDGQYRVEEARRVSEYAHQLGFSARQLSELEARVFAELRARGAERIARDTGDAGVSGGDDLTEPGGLGLIPRRG